MLIKRSEFIAFLAATAGFYLPPSLSGQIKPSPKYVVADLRNKPDWRTILESGLIELGGIDRFIKRKSKVLIKPTMAWDRQPGTGYNSYPNLVRGVINLCFNAGASEVWLFDNTFDDWATTYKNSGIERISKDNGGRVLPANDFRYYIPVENTGSVKKLHVHKAVAEADVIINLPAVYFRKNQKINGALFNYTGILWERTGCIDDIGCIEALINYRSPQLNISEAGILHEGQKPDNQALVLSTDLIGADILTSDWMNVELTSFKLLEPIAVKFRISTKINATEIKRIQH